MGGFDSWTDVGEPPLWTFSEAARAIAARRRRRGARAVALPSVWRPRASYRSGCNSQRWYTESFNAAFPGVAGILAEHDGVYVAGAAANWPIASDKRGGPGWIVDFFIVGGDPAAVGDTVDRIRAGLRTGKPAPAVPPRWTTIMTPGMCIMSRDDSPLTFRIALRAFESVRALVDNFTIPTARIAFDGRVAHMTFAAVWAQVHGINVVDCGDAQLVEYFRRGYGVAADFGELGGKVARAAAEPPEPPGPPVPRTRIDQALYNINQIPPGGMGRYIVELGDDLSVGTFVAAPPTLDDILPYGLFIEGLDAATLGWERIRQHARQGNLEQLRWIFDTEVAEYRRLRWHYPGGIPRTLMPYRTGTLLNIYMAAPRDIRWV